MDYLWSPWRFHYVSAARHGEGCVFCQKARADTSQDRTNLVLYRAQLNYIILNLFPYTTGHLMVVPYAHVSSLTDLDSPTLSEMMELARDAQAALERAYHPEGYNLGMNQGTVAGAGVADHVHLHLLPRWAGDANFMSTIGETRVLPEDLATTFEKLVTAFRRRA
jgi:ATP adenylyltransferase